MYKLKAAEWRPQHFKWEVKDRVATVTLNRPERKNPLTFESYAELRDTFHKLQYADDVRVVVFTGEGGNFCSGGDVHEIIGPLIKMDMAELLAFTRMTGNLVKEMRTCPQPIIAAVDGVCAGAGRDHLDGDRPALRDARGEDRVPVRARRPGRLRHGRLRHPAAHHRPGPRRGAALHRPRHERRGRPRLGLLQRGRAARTSCSTRAQEMAHSLADGPAFAHAMTKKCLHQEWNLTIEQALETEAEAQAICMQTKDFERAYNAFVAKEKPKFEGN